MTENCYRLLVVDVDGTLVGEDSQISTANREALARVRSAGITVSLSTGRSSQACLHLLEQLSLDGYHTFCDGALVSNPHNGAEVYAEVLDREVVKHTIDFAHHHEIDLDFYSAAKYFVEQETWSAQAHREFFGVEPHVASFNGLWERERLIKGGMVSRNPEDTEKVMGLCRAFEDKFRFTWVTTPAYPGVYFINIIAAGVSKGNAMKALASHMGLELSEIMAVGDGDNDLSMFSTAGLSVAMENAPVAVKAAADYTTLSVQQNGLAAAIDRFLLCSNHPGEHPEGGS